MSNVNIGNFDDAFSSDCLENTLNNELCIYWCYIYGILSAGTDMVVPDHCSNLTNPTEIQITQKDEIGIILGSISFVFVFICFIVFFIRKYTYTIPVSHDQKAQNVHSGFW